MGQGCQKLSTEQGRLGGNVRQSPPCGAFETRSITEIAKKSILEHSDGGAWVSSLLGKSSPEEAFHSGLGGCTGLLTAWRSGSHLS